VASRRIDLSRATWRGKVPYPGVAVDSCRECDNCQKGDEQYCLPGNTQTYGFVDRNGTATRSGYSKALISNTRPTPPGSCRRRSSPNDPQPIGNER
jgi:hypothetical protein